MNGNEMLQIEFDQVAEETSHLAPHGVPSNPIPRALSSSRLNDLQNQNANGADSYGTYQTTGGNLDIPGAPRNPFQKQSVQPEKAAAATAAAA